MKITNDQGRTFLVRVVRKGEKWGLNDCLTHEEDDPLIEFYDQTNAGKKGFGERGQFVSNYYARTLASDAKSLRERGLCLDGGNRDVWGIDGAALGPVLDLAIEIHAPKKPGDWL